MAVHLATRRRRGFLYYAAIVAIGLVVGIVVGIVLVVATKKTYASNSTLFVSVPSQSATQLYDNNAFAQARVQSYVDVATSPQVLRAVIRDTNLSISENTLASEVTAVAPPNKVLLQLTVQDPSARRALTLIKSLDSQVVDTVQNLETDSTGKSTIRLSVIRAPQLPTSAAAPRPTLYIGIAALLGLVLGVVVALALGQFNGRRDEAALPRPES